MAKITRISTTLTARYSPASGATDAFWLDGRILGPRESRSADITLDREDKGFLFATFASPSTGDIGRDIDAAKAVLDKTALEIKHSGKNIDNQITDLAECSVGVTGRASLQNEGVRQPFFAGIMVKDSEVAAVTTGRGCAYLYRNDTLYPLTKDDIPFESIDYSGKNVPNIDIYCAGIAGTVRYSNIAQLQVDDCIIVCNREIMDAIGQRELLRLLYEANDQCDAAGLVITHAAAKMPGTPLQFMIGFVESISTGERASKVIVPPIPVKVNNKSSADAFNTKYEHNEKIEDDDYVSDDDYEQNDYDDEYEENDRSKTKKLALITVIAIVVIACAFAIFTMLNGNRGGSSNNPTPTPTIEVSQDVSLDSSSSVSQEQTTPTKPAATPTTPAVATPTKGGSIVIPANHTIAAGELLPSIAKRYYNSTDLKYIDAIIAANKTKYPSFSRSSYQQGWEIVIPKV